MKPFLLMILILGIFVERISNEEIFTELDKILEQIPTEQKDSDDLIGSFVSFGSMIIDRAKKGKLPPVKENYYFAKKFRAAQFSVGKYTAFHSLNFLSFDEAENYLVIGTLDKDDPKYVKFAFIQTKVRILSKDYYLHKNILDNLNKKKETSKYPECYFTGGCRKLYKIMFSNDPDYAFLRSHGLTLDTLTNKVKELYSSCRENLRQSIEDAFSDCSRRCKKKRKSRRQACLNECYDKRYKSFDSLKYKMSLEIKQLLKKKFESTAFRTQILNYFNKGVFQTENVFNILKTELQKLETKAPENIYNYVLNTNVLTNYVSDVTRKGDYSKYNLNNAIKSQLEMLQFTSQVDLKAFNFEAQLSTGEYEQIIGVGIVDPNDQNLVHLTFFQARARSKLRQQYKYPYPECTKKYYTTKLERVTYPRYPFRFSKDYKKLMEEYNQFLKDYPLECFKEERGLLPSEISLIKTKMKSHIYKALKEKIERVYVK